MKIVADAGEPARAGQVSEALGKGTLPGQAEGVRAKLKRLPEQGWLHRTPGGRFTVLDDQRQRSASPVTRVSPTVVGVVMPTDTTVTGGPDPLVHQCRPPLSSATLDMAAGRVRARPKKIGSRWRTLPPGRIALIVPAVLRHDQRLSGLAGACQVSASTVRRWLLEAVHLLAARAERLDRALKKTVKRGGTVVPIDSTLIPTRRRTGTDDRPDYSDKRKMHGLHVLALTDDEDNLIRGLGRPARAAPTTSPPPVTTTSPPICARPGSERSATSASPAWTTIRTTPSSSPATASPADAVSPLRRRKRTSSWPANARRTSTGSPTRRTGACSPSSAWAPGTRPRCCGPCSSSPASKPPGDDDHPEPIKDATGVEPATSFPDSLVDLRIRS